MTYKPSVPTPVRRIVEYQLENLAALRRDVALRKDAKIPSATPSYSPTPGHSSDTHRTTEDIALSIITDPYIQSAERIIRTIDNSMGTDPLTDRLIQRVYLAPTRLTVEAAAEREGIAPRSAYYRIGCRIGELAVALGYVPAKQ